MEMHVKISDTVGIAELRIDGNTTNEITFNGDTKNGGTNASIDNITFSHSGLGITMWFTDVYICDTTGSNNNSWLGDVTVRTLVPSGNGASSQLVGSDADSTNNYLLVSQQPVTSATYVGSPTTGQYDSYTLGDLPAAVTQVFGVQLNSFMGKSDATLASAKPFLNIAGTKYYGTTDVLGTTNQTYCDIYNTNPGTTLTWTISDVNGLEAGMEVG